MRSILLGAALLCCWPAFAQELVFRWGGRLQSDVRFRPQAKETGAFYNRLELPAGVERNENILKLKLDAIYGSFAGVADIDFVWLGRPRSLESVADLSTREYVDPYYLQVHALYLEATDLLVDGLDLRVGQQQVKWGVGDQFNPTNNINANDLEDVLLFGEQLANLMLRLDYALHDQWSLSAVLVPLFKPALLPRSAPLGVAAADRYPFTDERLRHRIRSEQALSRALGWPAVVSAAEPVLPADGAENMQFGLRLAGVILEQDVAVSYYHGRSDFPLPMGNHTVQSPYDQPRCNPGDEQDYVQGQLETTAYLGYPRMQVVGLNLAGEIDPLGGLRGVRPLGYRLEFAAVFPKRRTMGLFQEELNFGIVGQAAGEYDYDGDGTPGGRPPAVVDSIPFFKWVLGLDYSFGAHVYANVMWIHGLVDEFGIGWAVRRGESESDLDELLACQLSGEFRACESRELLRPRLGDYLVLGLDIKLVNERMLLRLFSILDLTGMDEGVWDRRANRQFRQHHPFYSRLGFSAVIFPEFNYNFGNGLDLGAGALLQLGREHTKFGDPAAGGSLIWTRARFSF